MWQDSRRKSAYLEVVTKATTMMKKENQQRANVREEVKQICDGNRKVSILIGF